MRTAFPVRPWAAFLALSTLSLLASAAPARAEDEEEAIDYTAYDMALAKGALPEGWRLLESAEGAADETALKAQITEMAKTAKAADGLDIVLRSAAKADKKAVFALVDLAAKSDDLVKALVEQGKEKGWSSRMLGSPLRLLVVSAPDDLRDAAMTLQAQYAARMLAIKAQGSYEARMGPRILMYAKAARAIDPKNALAALYMGILVGGQGAQTKDEKMLAEGIEVLRSALAKDATSPLAGRELTTARGELGGLILQKGGPSAEARDFLKDAVKGAADVEREMGLVYLYNLACAQGRLKELDDAFANLSKLLEEHTKKPIQGIDWTHDPDFDNLKADPRWAELLKKYPVTVGGE